MNPRIPKFVFYPLIAGAHYGYFICLRLTPAWDARGLKFVSKDRQLRFCAIAEELAESSYDVIALQEVWVRADYETIRSKAARRLPHSKFFHAYVLVNV